MIRTIKKKKGALSSELTKPSAMYQWASRRLLRYFRYFPSDEQYNITICHEKKFIWFRVAKVGTRTIFNVFDKANITLDAEHPFLCHYPANLYRDYFKFAFVRNPWDRLVSCWHNKVIDDNYFKFSNDVRIKMQNFANFVDYVTELDINKCDLHLRLQSKLIDLNNVDYIGRFENFSSDLSEVIQTLGLGKIEIEKKNTSSTKRDYRDYYDKNLRQKVAKLYSKDIRIFSYDV
jgi:hypothetical protein